MKQNIAVRRTDLDRGDDDGVGFDQTVDVGAAEDVQFVERLASYLGVDNTAQTDVDLTDGTTGSLDGSYHPALDCITGRSVIDRLGTENNIFRRDRYFQFTSNFEIRQE